MADFVTLSCPSCGGKLQITQDIDRFACAHCGQEHIVNRNGGIISLTPVMDALNKVGIGVDKTAAELAIVRLHKEIGELHAHRIALFQFSPRPATSPIFVVPLVLGCIIAPSFLFSVINSQNISQTINITIGFLFGTALIIIGAVPLFFKRPNTKRWDETTGVQLKSLDEQLSAKNVELIHAQNIVSQ